MSGPARPIHAAAVLLLGLLAAAEAGAQTPGPRPPGPPPRAAPDTNPEDDEGPPAGAPTRIGQQLLARSDLVVIARTDGIDAAGVGVVAARLDVVAIIADGEAARPRPPGALGEVLVIAFPGTFTEGGRQVVFLRDLGGGERYEVVHRVDANADRYADRIAICRRTAELARIRDPARRARATLDWLVPAVAGPDEWWAQYALDELTYMVAEQPWVFDTGAAERLRAAASRAREPAVAEGVKNVARRVEEQRRRLLSPPEKARSSR